MNIREMNGEGSPTTTTTTTTTTSTGGGRSWSWFSDSDSKMVEKYYCSVSDSVEGQLNSLVSD